MFNPLKNMIWLLCSVMLCLGAAVWMMEQVREQDITLEHLVPHIHIQQHNISDSKVTLTDQQSNNLSLISGLEILYGLRGWYEQGIEIVLDGYVLSPFHNISDHTPEAILKQAVVRLEMDSLYNAIPEFNSNGTLLRIVFVKT